MHGTSLRTALQALAQQHALAAAGGRTEQPQARTGGKHLLHQTRTGNMQRRQTRQVGKLLEWGQGGHGGMPSCSARSDSGTQP
ncbi:hypothetical protein ppKF707_5930 [Metapseudomonas furukawaii]|nr:hypothetical protein ppKF707_1505 [Pseudomonas furukawaii]ELS28230.1 hypothetical protein ppKF707_5930 [Pseudomonas furukawaii]